MVVLATTQLLQSTGVARPVLTVSCTEPAGSRIDHYGGKFVEGQDGFTGVLPVFIFDDANRSQATVVFGPTRPAVSAGVRDTGAYEATVLVNTPEQITLMASTGTHIAQMYSLYPKAGLAYFTLHKHLPVQGGVASTATMVSKCEFKKS